MSYSRWSNSRWYTYWLAQKTPLNHNNATFQVDDMSGVSRCFQAAKIRKDVDQCVRSICADVEATPEEAAELRGYMLAFLANVDDEFLERK